LTTSAGQACEKSSRREVACDGFDLGKPISRSPRSRSGPGFRQRVGSADVEDSTGAIHHALALGINFSRRPAGAMDPLATLSTREREVLALMAEGRSQHSGQAVPS